MKRTLHTFILLCLSLGFAKAQESEFTPHFELGIFLGGSLYEGDVAPKELGKYYQTVNPAYGILSKYHINERIALRLEANHIEISGNDDIGNRSKRGINFQTTLLETALSAEFTAFQLPVGDRVVVKGHAYIGGAYTKFNPKTNYKGRIIETQPLGTEGQGIPGFDERYKLNVFSLPAGVGFQVEIDKTWTIGFELAGRKAWSDYLDDVGSTPIAYQTFMDNDREFSAMVSRPNFNPDTDDPNAVVIRGDVADDCYFPFGITITRTFGGKRSAPSDGQKGGKQGCPTAKGSKANGRFFSWVNLFDRPKVFNK